MFPIHTNKKPSLLGEGSYFFQKFINKIIDHQDVHR